MLCCIVLYCTVLFCIILYCPIPYIALSHIILHCIISYCSVQCLLRYTLYYTVYFVLYALYFIPYYTILYYAIRYYTILHEAMLSHTAYSTEYLVAKGHTVSPFDTIYYMCAIMLYIYICTSVIFVLDICMCAGEYSGLTFWGPLWLNCFWMWWKGHGQLPVPEAATCSKTIIDRNKSTCL